MSSFGQLAKKYEALSKKPAVVAANASAIIKILIQKEFSSGNDPYGRPWKALDDGTPSRLYKSGALLGSLDVSFSGTQIKISFSDYKFAFHQKLRPILSIGVMPQTWSQAIETSFSESMKK